MSSSNTSCFNFEIIAKCSYTKARYSKLTLSHSVVQTPVFMPVGTQGSMKGITTEQLSHLGCQICLANTYHLGHRPGPDTLQIFGGLHKFMDWNKSLLTEGVTFQSPHDGSILLLTPEKSMELQNIIGADIIMQLDDVVSSLTSGPRVEEAMHRSIRWLDRCIIAHKNKETQNLFSIIQGGLDKNLRSICIDEMIQRNTPGYAIGGLSGGENKDEFWKIVSLCTDKLPEKKPRYCMGVGYATDLVICSALGVDMYDCVYPTRTARFGVALVKTGTLNLRKKEFENEMIPIDDHCLCYTCKNYTRSYLHSLVTHETVSCSLLTLHNISYQLNLMEQIRQSIMEDRFVDFIRVFMTTMYPKKNYPEWSINALESLNIKLS